MDVSGEIKAWRNAVLCEFFDVFRDCASNQTCSSFVFFDLFFTDNFVIRRSIDLATECVVK